MVGGGGKLNYSEVVMAAGGAEPLRKGSILPGIPRKITGFHQDEQSDWVAELECGHTQHIRHNPPWQSRPWVITPEGRSAQIGRELLCAKCQEPPADDA